MQSESQHILNWTLLETEENWIQSLLDKGAVFQGLANVWQGRSHLNHAKYGAPTSGEWIVLIFHLFFITHSKLPSLAEKERGPLWRDQADSCHFFLKKNPTYLGGTFFWINMHGVELLIKQREIFFPALWESMCKKKRHP